MEAGCKPDERKFLILIVEDEIMVALQLKNDLETAGHKVVALTTNVAQGIDLASSSEFDAALLDICLGEHLSTPVADTLLGRGIPFAFITGFGHEEILPPHLRAIPRLTKPYDTKSVGRLLSRF